MAYLFWGSATWRRVVARSRESPLFFAGVSVACFSACGAAALGIQALTNPGTVDLGGKHPRQPGNSQALKDLARQGRPDAALIGQVNKARLGQLLSEIEHKENTEDRYAAALRGETLVGAPGARHTAAGSSAAVPSHAGSQAGGAGKLAK